MADRALLTASAPMIPRQVVPPPPPRTALQQPPSSLPPSPLKLPESLSSLFPNGPPSLPRKRPTTQSPLPSLRLLLHPTPGLGLDARLPLSKHLKCYMQLESYFSGGSQIAFGIHPARLPCLRLQLAPSARFTFRLPVQIARQKFVHAGGDLVLYDRGQGFVVDGLPQWNGWGWQKVWRLVKPFCCRGLELRHHHTFSGMLDGNQRKQMHEVLSKAMARRKRADGAWVDARGMPKPVEGGLPPIEHLDPRNRTADPVEGLRRKVREQYEGAGMNAGGRYIDEKRAKIAFEQEGMSPRLVDEINEVKERNRVEKGGMFRWFKKR